MTEDEAKTKRCCGPEGCGGNPNEALSGMRGRHCIGSACMAWVWSNTQYADKALITAEMVPTRIFGTFEYEGIRTVGQARAKSDAELLKLPNFGKESLKELRKILGRSSPSAVPQGYCGLLANR